jgi:hypothetical protein
MHDLIVAFALATMLLAPCLITFNSNNEDSHDTPMK